AKSQIGCAAWRSSAKSFPARLENGMKLVAFGSVQVYEPRGQYQLIVERIIAGGLGSLQQQYDELKRKLAAEGLFDQARKRPLPQYPNRIGIVTSPTGAAIEDMLRILTERWPAIEVVLAPVKVQGEGSKEEIAAAIARFNKWCGTDSPANRKVDVLIVGRGGGSLEDLWSFNEEVVVRAVVASAIPVISAVGHEVDVALTDFAADIRAATPTAAAQMAVPDRDEHLEWLHDQREKLTNAIQRKLKYEKQRLEQLMKRSGFRRPVDRVMQWMQRVDELERRTTIAYRTLLQRKSEQVRSLQSRFDALHPLNILARGFAVVRLTNGRVIRSAEQASFGSRLEITLHEGKLIADTIESNR
ncbi:MAG: exodeoxyribonuclease VII large subunit, partial [bacterium]|nr:exodeoxyribonuclease VII large subunit [bacterium]